MPEPPVQIGHGPPFDPGETVTQVSGQMTVKSSLALYRLKTSVCGLLGMVDYLLRLAAIATERGQRHQFLISGFGAFAGCRGRRYGWHVQPVQKVEWQCNLAVSGFA